MHPRLMATMFKARVYFYLEPRPGPNHGRFSGSPTVPSAVDDSVLGLTESQFLDFLHDSHHRFAVVSTPERTDDSARQALESKHPGRSIVVKSLNWI